MISASQKTRTLIEKLDDELPPFKAYYLARKYPRGPLAGPVVISKRSGIPYRTVQRLSAKLSWDGVDLDVASAFISACGFQRSKGNIFVMNKYNALFRWCKEKALVPLKSLNNMEFRRYDSLCRQWNRLHNGDSKSVPVNLSLDDRPERHAINHREIEMLAHRNDDLKRVNKRVRGRLRDAREKIRKLEQAQKQWKRRSQKWLEAQGKKNRP